MGYAIVLGSNVFIGTSGVITAEENGKVKEFFRIRELQEDKLTEAYIIIDCELYDPLIGREVNVKNNKSVDVNKDIIIYHSRALTKIDRLDGSTIIKIEKIDLDDASLPKTGPVPENLRDQKVEELFRFTGKFYIGSNLVEADYEKVTFGDAVLPDNVKVGSGSIHISSNGITMD